MYQGKHQTSQVYISPQRAIDLIVRSIVVSTIIGIAIGAAIFGFICWNMSQSYQAQINDLRKSLDDWDNRYQEGVKEATDKVSLSFQTQIDNLESEKEALNVEINALTDDINRLNESLTEATNEKEDDFNIIQRYWYILRDASDNSGLTLDLLRWQDELGQRFDTNPHLMWAIYKEESTYNVTAQNAKSSARGLGQTLESSAKLIYENVLGHGKGSYNHSMAFDPYVNMEIATCMISRNLNQGVTAALDLYGDGTSTYPSRILHNATENGTPISDSNCHYPY